MVPWITFPLLLNGGMLGKATLRGSPSDIVKAGQLVWRVIGPCLLT